MPLREIARLLGGEVSGRQVLCPGPGHSRRDRSLAVKLNGVHFIVYSFAGQDWQACKDYVAERLGLERFKPRHYPRTAEAAAPSLLLPGSASGGGSGEIDANLEQRVERALKLWGQSVLLPDTLGWRYFTERRGLHIGLLDPLEHCLRWHNGAGAIVALMTDPLSNEPCGVHRTYLNPDATKRERKMLGKAGIIRLAPNEDVLEGLGICEGIEDALAILLTGWAPVWAATSAGAIERFAVLSIESLTIFVDEDPPGIKAAQACAERWALAGREARIAHPKELKP